ncbi:uncharacterized protein LOC141640282 [Silene latifolia]|uniref:uncharacterized protein LOC141640282 n=1 Tax=Silene latifolia TaxID=37657 RepID=UPI003D76D5C7
MAKKLKSKSSLNKRKIISKAKLRLSFSNMENLRLDNDVTVEPTEVEESSSVVAAIPPSADARTTRSVGEIVGIPVINLDTVVEDDVDSIVEENPGEETETEENPIPDEAGWTRVTGKKRSQSPVSSSQEILQITAEEVQPEIEYWSTAVVCYVLGGNPPWARLSGFITNLWGKYKFDKVSFPPNGAFLVHFPTLECRNLVLKQGFPMFENKPLVVKPWTDTTSMAKERVKSVPVWIRLCGLGLKFWGEKTLEKLATLVGKYMRADSATMDKTRLGYARIMVEVEVGQEFPDKIYFKDEKGSIVCVCVEYEWKPVVCGSCKGIGHTKDVCKKPTAAPRIIQLLNDSDQHITVEVSDLTSGDSFWYTVVYGSNYDILDYNERLGRVVTWNKIRDFRQCVEYCEVTDIVAHGSSFTWNNKQDPSTRVFSRIDRCLINIDWLQRFPDSSAFFMNEGTFDHCPCICYRRDEATTRKSSFKYFNMWSLDSNFKAVVATEWNKTVFGVKMYQVVTKLKNLKKPLKELNKNKFSEIEKSAEVARVILDNLQTKAKVEWILEGDENTRFYHSRIKARQIHNKVTQIVDKDGVTHQDPLGIENAFLSYYNDLLGSSNHTIPVHKPTVRTADKSPGPDGYTSQFYKDSWDIVGQEVCDAVKDFFHSGQLLKQLNTTNITLIPKGSNPKTVFEFRPIACCNTLYKCIAKLLCNRLGDILPDIVSINQGGFIKGRNIVENVLICQDIVRLYNRQTASPRCLVKIDLKKAYDSVEWEFLEQMLGALNLPEQFTNWIMKCVTTPSFSLSLNGKSFGFFKGKRGLRQGDPLSPLLFTLCMDYLSRILAVVRQQDGFRFHPLCGHLKLNHLLFADDLLMFSKGNAVSIMWILRAFATFSSASGLFLNKDKTEIFFNGVRADTVNEILQISGFKKGALPFKYLGVPISSKKLSKNEGRKLTDKITARIRAWGDKHLTYAGRLTLVTSVLHTLHSYWATIFLIPTGIMNNIDRICRNYLWSGKDSYLRAPAVGWDQCCKPKAEGGLGIKNSKMWNKALLGKYAWWVADKKDHLWMRWINHVYLRGGHWTNYSPPSDCSWSLKKIAHIMLLFRSAYIDDQWLGTSDAYTIKAGYDWIRTPGNTVNWWKLCWNSLNVPKSSFIYWAVMLGRLLTRDRLAKMGGPTSMECYLCQGADESHRHLFFECEFSRKCSDLLQQKLTIRLNPRTLVEWNKRGRRLSILRRRMARNKARTMLTVIHPKVIVQQAIQAVSIRFWARNKAPIKEEDISWLNSLHSS